jgi:hypothetical protein
MFDQDSLKPVILSMVIYLIIAKFLPEILKKPTGITIIDDLTMMLIAPSVLGLYVWFARSDTVETDIYTTFYAFFMVLWGFGFLQTWTRTANGCAGRWDTLDAEQTEELNPNFQGKERVSPVTGTPELHYKSHKRWMTYALATLPVTVFMLAVAFVTLSLSLNLQGYVETDSPICKFTRNLPFL